MIAPLYASRKREVAANRERSEFPASQLAVLVHQIDKLLLGVRMECGGAVAWAATTCRALPVQRRCGRVPPAIGRLAERIDELHRREEGLRRWAIPSDRRCRHANPPEVSDFCVLRTMWGFVGPPVSCRRKGARIAPGQVCPPPQRPLRSSLIGSQNERIAYFGRIRVSARAVGGGRACSARRSCDLRSPAARWMIAAFSPCANRVRDEDGKLGEFPGCLKGITCLFPQPT